MSFVTKGQFDRIAQRVSEEVGPDTVYLLIAQELGKPSNEAKSYIATDSGMGVEAGALNIMLGALENFMPGIQEIIKEGQKAVQIKRIEQMMAAKDA